MSTLDILFEPFLVRAVIGGVGVAIIAGAIGCLVVWRRMAYFGDSLAYSALLGIALGLAVGINLNLSTLLTCSVFAVALLWLQQRKILATDTLLGILAHAALAAGMITLSFLEQERGLQTYLFGDILTVTTQELWWIYIGGALILPLLAWNWSALVLMTIHEDLARAENINTIFTQMLLLFLMTLVVAVSIRIVGILLITSLLIIPAAAARFLARTPQTMAITSALVGVLSVLIGVYSSLYFDTPSGPSIIMAATFLFMLLLSLFSHRMRY